jgi:hypothetical protein
MTLVLSGFVFVLLAGVAFMVRNPGIWILMALIFGVGYAFSPRSYFVSDDAITIRRLIGSVRFPLASLSEARRATPDDLRGCIRVFGSGGLFGYYGLFRTSALGTIPWYVTNRQNMVLVRGEKSAMFSPDDVDGFLVALGKPTGDAPSYELSLQKSGGNMAMRLQIGLALLLGVVTLGAVGFAVTYSPGPPACTFDGNRLTIHDRFYPVTLNGADVDAANIRVVDIGPGSDWQPVSRTNGFANAHYRSGWFRVRNGQKVRLYVESAKRVVLIPPKGSGNAVLLEVADPQSFVDAAQHSLQ